MFVFLTFFIAALVQISCAVRFWPGAPLTQPLGLQGAHRLAAHTAHGSPMRGPPLRVPRLQMQAGFDSDVPEAWKPDMQDEHLESEQGDFDSDVTKAWRPDPLPDWMERLLAKEREPAVRQSDFDSGIPKARKPDIQDERGRPGIRHEPISKLLPRGQPSPRRVPHLQMQADPDNLEAPEPRPPTLKDDPNNWAPTTDESRNNEFQDALQRVARIWKPNELQDPTLVAQYRPIVEKKPWTLQPRDSPQPFLPVIGEEPIAPAEQGQPIPPTMRCINALTLATKNMSASCAFYSALGLTLTYGGPTSNFSTYSADPNQNLAHVNLCTTDCFTPPPSGTWNGWGRCVFYVDNVDAFYSQAVAQGLKPEFAPQDAVWGERYFHILDPQGHELSFATPIYSHPRWQHDKMKP